MCYFPKHLNLVPPIFFLTLIWSHSLFIELVCSYEIIHLLPPQFFKCSVLLNNRVLNAQQRFAFFCSSWNRVCRVPRFCCVKHPIECTSSSLLVAFLGFFSDSFFLYCSYFVVNFMLLFGLRWSILSFCTDKFPI